jgi:hypothetical protein
MPSFINSDPNILSKSAYLGAYCDNIKINQYILPIGNFLSPAYADYINADLRYVISSGWLMRYTPTMMQYKSIMPLQPWQTYNITSH